MDQVSVIVPVYNIEDYLPRCIESIQAQTYRELDIVLVNDGSTDASGEICDKYAESDNRIRVFHQSNGGASYARNIGLDNAEGDYICFVDGDDLIHQQMIELLMRSVERDPEVDIVTCKLKVFREQFDTIQPIPHSSVHTLNGVDALTELLYQRVVNGPVGKLFKKSLIKDVRFPVGIKIGEDLLTNIVAFQRASKINLTSHALYGYYMRPGSAMHSSTIADRICLIRNLEKNLAKQETIGPLASAFSNRIFTESMYASTALIEKAENMSTADRKSVAKIIRKYRKSVVQNPHSMAFYRFLAALSFLSPQMPAYAISLRRKISKFVAYAKR